MAYDRKRKLLFIHIPKNAGKSIEIAMGFVDRKTKANPRGRSILNGIAKKFLNLTTRQKNKEMLWGPIDYVLSGQHLTCQEIELLNFIDILEFQEALKFAVIRNPFDRAISTFTMFTQSTSLEEFKFFWDKKSIDIKLDHNKVAHRRSQLSFLLNTRGKMEVDELIRYENLDEDFQDFCKKYNFNIPILPHIGARQCLKKDYRTFYDRESKEMIQDYFKEDFEAFGYVF